MLRPRRGRDSGWEEGRVPVGCAVEVVGWGKHGGEGLVCGG